MPEQMKKTYITPEANQWKPYSLADFATIAQGYTFSKAYQGKDDGRWQYFKVADIGLESNGKYLRKAINSINDETMQLIGCKPFPKGSIVFPRVGAALLNNNKKILAQDSVVDDNVLVLSITNRDICNDEYLYYALQQIRLDSWSNSSLVPVISSTTVLKQKILLPTIAEQRRIAKILSTQDRVIELYDRKIEQLKRFKKGMLSKLFPKPGRNTPEIRFTGFTEPWKRCRLSDLYNYACSGGTPSSNIEDYYNGSIPFLGISDIASRVIMNTKKYISEEGLNNSSATIIPAGAITLAMYASVGKVAIAGVPMATSQAFFNMVFTSTTTRDFIFNILEKAELFAEWEPLISTGTQRNLNAEKIKNHIISIPAKDEMTAISSCFALLDRLFTLHQRLRDEEIQKKKALMQLLLTGIVRVKG